MKKIWITLIVFVTFSCTKADRTITLSYEPQVYVAKIDQAKDVPLTIVVQDERKEKLKVGSIPIDQIGLFKVPVKIEQQADLFLKEALEIELKQRGFTIHEGGKVIKLDLLQLFGDLDQTEFTAGSQRIYKHDAIGGLVLGLRVVDRNQKVLYAKKLQKAIRTKNSHGIFKSSKDTTVALNLAIHNLFVDLFEDNAFISALLRKH